MSSSIEELARTDTELGEIVLRRRFELVSRQDIFEVFLAGDGLMSSLFTHGEEQLVALGLAALGDTIGPGTADVVVGGLGLGYSARTVLRDARCTLVHGDFFTVVDQAPPMLPGGPAQFDAILVDIDHSPRHLLDPSHATLYTPSGRSGRLRELLTEGSPTVLVYTI